MSAHSRGSAWATGRACIRAHSYPLAAAALIALAAGIRVGLLRAGWPGTDSDDATMGLMAKHILTRGEHPLFFYGQAYMGTIEAYLGALMFAFMGVSVFALKCGLVLLYAAFMIVMYLLLARLFDRRWALVGLALLALGDDYMLYHQLEAYGGYLETLFFGVLMLLLTYELVRTAGDPRPAESAAQRQAFMPRTSVRQPFMAASSHTRRQRWLLFGWGLAAGLGLWSDPLVAPFVLCTALVLALTGWRELRSRRGALALLGLLLGLSPWIAYIVTSAPGGALSFLQHAGQPLAPTITPAIVPSATPPPSGTSSAPAAIPTRASPSVTSQHSPLDGARDHLLGIVLIAVPNTTGVTTLCSLDVNDAWPPSQWTTPRIQRCMLLRAAWGAAVLVLLGTALTLEVAVFLRLWRAARRPSASPLPAERAEAPHWELAEGADLSPRFPLSTPPPSVSSVVNSAARARAAARAAALAAPLLTTLLFGVSSVAAFAPWNYARYLISLLIAVPVALAILWDHTPAHHPRKAPSAASHGLQFLASLRQHFTVTSKRESPAAPAEAPPTSSPPASSSLPSVFSVISVVQSLSLARIASAAATGILLVALALGVVGTFRSAPTIAAQAAQQQDLVNRLLANGQTRVYADYWTCLRTIFESDERVICSVVRGDLSLAPNRYPPYDALVRVAPSPAYVFALDTPQANSFPVIAAAHGWRYTRATVDGQWVIYTLLQ